MTETPVQPLRVLFVEDVEVDVDLALLALERGGFEVSWTRVEDAAGLTRALDAEVPQVVLSDFTMPRFDGMSALRLVRERAPELPFIFLSGTIGEERAIESIRGGATDYVLKSNMRRLSIAIRRALDDVAVRSEAVALDIARRRLASILEATSDFVSICDREGRVVYLNPAGRALVGLPDDPERQVNILDLHPEWAAHRIREEAWPEALATGVWHGETALLGSIGEEIPVSHVVVAHRDLSGDAENFATIARDIRDRKRYEERIAFLANHDALTGLPNRALLEDRVGQATTYLKRGDRPIAVLVADIDRFKLVNDGIGQSAGDELLQAVATRLVDAVRDGDTVARVGGDTFALLATDLAHADDVLGVVRKIQDAVAEPFTLGDRQVHISVTMGASVFPRDGTDFAALMRAADTAMHRAKSEGQGRFQFYASEMTEDVSKRVELEYALRNALVRNEIELHYQPLISIRDRNIVGFEALMRWHQRDHGWVSPAVFIPIAEHSNQIQKLGAWALNVACDQLRVWTGGKGDMRISVNVSARQFLDPEFPDIVAEVLRYRQLEPTRLVLELTESVLVEDVSSVARALDRLNGIGVGVAIDDFGTGYSSLSYLSRLPIDCLKIDRSFVQRFESDPYDAEIIRAIISLAAALEMKVVAEGVEERKQLEFLSAHGCDEAQGYLFSKPLPSVDVTKLIQESEPWPRN